MPILEILEQYGFATLAAIAMGWFIWLKEYKQQNINGKVDY